MTYAPVIRFRNNVYRVYLNPKPGMPAASADIDEGPFGPYKRRADASAALERRLTQRLHDGVVIEVGGVSYTDVTSAMAAILMRENEA